jgi:NitT/TauT family transport system substrate-binding protein
MKAANFLNFTGVAVLCMLLFTSCKAEKSRPGDGKIGGAAASRTETNFTIRYRPKWQSQAQFAGVYMAHHKGFYEQYGLDVKIQRLLQAHEATDSLYHGCSDVVHIDLLNALEENRDSTRIVNIGQVTQKNSVLLVGKKSRGINSLEDFRGKKLGMWRSGSFLITELFLLKSKIPMQVVPIDWSISLFTQDVVDVINAMRYNEYHQLLQAGIREEDLFVVDLAELGYQIPDEGFYVTPEFYHAHPQECEAFLRATMDGWLYAFSHREETLDLVLKRMQDDNIRANRTHQGWMLEQMKEVVMPSTDEMGILKKQDYQNALQLMTEFYDFPRNIPYEEFYPNAAKKRR